MEIELESKPPPSPSSKESGGLYAAFFMIGVAYLVPWNAFITAVDYFAVRFEEFDTLSTNVEFWFSVSYTYSALLFYSVLLSWGEMVPVRSRIVAGYVISLLMIIVCLVVIIVPLGTIDAFATILIAFFAIGIGSSMLSFSLFGFLANLPGTYTSAAMSGCGMAGVLVSVARVVTKALLNDAAPGISHEEKKYRLFISTLTYFMLAAVCVAVGLALFLYILKIPEVRRVERSLAKKSPYYDAAAEDSDDNASDCEEMPLLPEERSMTIWQIVYAIRWMAFSIFFDLFLTLAMFPGFVPCFESQYGLGDWLHIILITTYTISDLLGRLCPGTRISPSMSSTWLPILVVARVVFLPLFLFAMPASIIPPVFSNDILLIIFIFLFGISNGFLASWAMMIAPTLIPESARERSGFIMALSLNTGLTLGSTVGLVVSFLIN